MHTSHIALACVATFASFAVAQQTITITRPGPTITITEPESTTVKTTTTSKKPTTTSKITTTTKPGDGPTVTVTVTQTITTTIKYPTTTNKPTTTTKPTTTQPPDPNLTKCPVPLYYKCGGDGWTGCKKCVEGAVCTSQNQFYYQCVAPDPE